ncbi:hypothetical protein AB0O34_05735 [Sphaerisporangium sp. NPDC088356]|uniref:hypothetical protein n=1 Tax=Sphaerisporangium sp. NPDC088356 TaxID=3154871 RepID=UPI00343AF37C
MRRLLLALALLLGTLGAAPAYGSAYGSAADGCANAGTADFDGDGFNDVVVGDPLGDPPGTWAGGGHLFFLRGTREGFPGVRGTPFGGGGLAGWVARAGHIDGDRCLDLVVASPYWTGSAAEGAGGGATSVPGAGNVHVYWGGPGFGRTNAGRVELRAPEQRNGAHFGWSLAVASGLLAVGAPYEDADGVPDSGAVYLYGFGGADGRRPQAPRRVTQQSPGVPGNGEAGDLFGWSVALGALGGGPAPDLAVGAPYEDTDSAATAMPDAGAVTVLYDAGAGTGYRGTGWNLSELTQRVPAQGGDLFGYSLAYGEKTGVGFLAAGAPHADPAATRDAGVVQLIRRGRPGQDPQPAGTLWQGVHGVAEVSEPHDAFGFSLAFSGGDLVVGVPFDGDGTHPETGAVHVIPLAEPDLADTSGGQDLPWPPGRLIRAKTPQTYDHFGWSVSGAGGGWLVIGVPDRERIGAVALAPQAGGDARMLRPGDGRITPFPGRVQGADFGAAVAG